MAIEGPLRELGIHDVFQLLDLSRKTGVLRISSDVRQNKGTVYFDEGAVVYAEIHDNPHLIGALLVKSGKITEADLNRAREMQRQGDSRRLGEIMVDIGAISPRELERQIRFQIEEVIFEMMSWREGHFSFTEGSSNGSPTDAPVRIPIEALLMEGARRIDEWSRIERKIRHVGVIPLLAAAGAGDEGTLDLLPTEWEVLSAIDGQRSVREIAQMFGRSDFEVAKTVFGLESAGVLSISEPMTSGRAAAPDDGLEKVLEGVENLLAAGDLEGARARTEAALAVHPDEPPLHLMLGRVHRAAGRPLDAEDSFRKALRIDPMLAPAHRYLGDTLARQGRFAEAVEWWQRWLRIEERGEEEPDVSTVREAVQAAQRLDALLRTSE